MEEEKLFKGPAGNLTMTEIIDAIDLMVSYMIDELANFNYADWVLLNIKLSERFRDKLSNNKPNATV